MHLTRTCGLLPASLVVLALAVPVAGASVHGQGGTPLTEQIRQHRAETWRWERIMGKPRTPVSDRERTVAVPRQVLRIRDLWQERAERARKRGRRPPHLQEWRCIHRYEGAWNDPDPPYYGGLQMDVAFQRTYGPRLLDEKGTADNWTPLEQMWVAEKALRAGRGFHPWPTAARRCGLL